MVVIKHVFGFGKPITFIITISAFCFRYLLDNQVTGESSVDAYIKALKQGCRCVECK